MKRNRETRKTVEMSIRGEGEKAIKNGRKDKSRLKADEKITRKRLQTEITGYGPVSKTKTRRRR